MTGRRASVGLGCGNYIAIALPWPVYLACMCVCYRGGFAPLFRCDLPIYLGLGRRRRNVHEEGLSTLTDRLAAAGMDLGRNVDTVARERRQAAVFSLFS